MRVKINSNILTNEENKLKVIEQYTVKNPAPYADPVILKETPREPLITVESYTKKVENSIKRLYAPARLVRKMHAYDALGALGSVHTKAAE